MGKNKRLKQNGRQQPKKHKISKLTRPSGVSKAQAQKKNKDSLPTNASTDSKANIKPHFHTAPTIPFSPSENILLVGEGDLSFACSLITHHGCTNITATVLEPSLKELKEKYPHVEDNIQVVEDGGGSVRYGIDAKLLVSFFRQAFPSLSPTRGSSIIVTLFEGEPYTLWNIRDLARHSGLEVAQSFKFQASAYPGYKHARTLGVVKSKGGKEGGGWKGEERSARSYVFVRKGEGEVAGPGKGKKDESSDDEDENGMGGPGVESTDDIEGTEGEEGEENDEEAEDLQED
ncbi:uncharacterized protein RAG0_08049 [Rhynchosporium agropyri]|uniref:25S rRNA (uridine-N(3))-methyltransferase BMT5-like domain-containing protein n=1 Tax=Rhynchosporium agropyri TaxID=914238 RepID=A0A1E1KNZ0_9HELO|nr:uncharacterized protein RAG0_08049 [Rhynchosporium agropyri]